MKRKIGFVLFLILFTLISLVSLSAQNKFYVNLNDRADDLFKVTLIPEKLTERNKIYQFAATAPGTYQIMDIGRYVKSFKVFDKEGKDIPTVNISTNQWEISDPKSAAKIEYTIAETFDTPMDKDPVYPMCGSSLEEDHALINGQTVFGYFHGMQKYPIEIKLEYPEDWMIGTALEKNNHGYYYAPTYDYVVDSPILLGNLSKASTKIEKTVIDVFTYSKTGLIKSENILTSLEDILSATNQFLQGLPVERYVFLFHFENFSAGAWEHNYSSIYVMKEDTLKEQNITELRSTAAHEFFHIVTPLLIHSELVENFNYEKPIMSKHLWFYEGVTEWASDILQLRDYLITVDDYLRQVRQKLSVNDNFDQTISLTTLGIKSTERQDQYFNIYNKGSVVGTLLDIRLLELSNGKRGLRELILELAKKYGANKSFSEEKFFDEFVKMTYPEIGVFINNYIDGTEKLPVKDYFEQIGIEYTESAGVDSSRIGLGFGIGFKDGKFIVTNVEPSQIAQLKSGDLLFKFDGKEITLQNAQKLLAPIGKLKVGDSFKISILRDNEESEVNITVQPRQIRHVFNVMENPTKEQITLREAWMQNQMNYQGNMENR
ncbi:MAG: PDZ domain-containing protein [Melioribacteraceae bacterium]|nr:PDZ domain-containing protein [Melioribacteraceae bacterium]